MGLDWYSHVCWNSVWTRITDLRKTKYLLCGIRKCLKNTPNKPCQSEKVYRFVEGKV